MSKIIDRLILTHYKGKEYFNRDSVISYLKELDPELTESALTWRIHDLVKRYVIHQIQLS